MDIHTNPSGRLRVPLYVPAARCAVGLKAKARQIRTDSDHCSPRFSMQRRLAQYVGAFVLCLVAIQKLDDVGSGWAAQRDSRPPEECTVSEQGVVHSPTCTAREVAGASHSQSPQAPFCAAHTPWFWYDLGGTMCVCEKRWSRSDYWAKTVSSFAFNFPHFMTPFQIYIVYQRWQWVFMYITFNEVFEELVLGVSGYWGFTFDPPFDLEPRYDSLIRDVLLCGFPGLLMGIAFVHVFKVPSFMVAPLDPAWEAVGRRSKQHHVKIFFQMLVLKQIALVYNTDRGVRTFYPQNALLIGLNVSLIGACFVYNRHDWPLALQPAVRRFHAAWASASVLLWLPTVYPVLDELYLLACTAACAGMCLLAVLALTRKYAFCSRVLLGLELHTACLSLRDYHAWVDNTDTPVYERGTSMFTHTEYVRALDSLSFEHESRAPVDSLLSALFRAQADAAARSPSEHDEACATSLRVMPLAPIELKHTPEGKQYHFVRACCSAA